jgi:hypothetical protein
LKTSKASTRSSRRSYKKQTVNSAQPAALRKLNTRHSAFKATKALVDPELFGFGSTALSLLINDHDIP